MWGANLFFKHCEGLRKIQIYCPNIKLEGHIVVKPGLPNELYKAVESNADILLATSDVSLKLSDHFCYWNW